MKSIWRWIITRLTRQKPVPRPNGAGSGASDIAARVIACATTVSNTLGSGLPEIIYENALACELRKAGLTVGQQHAVAVYYGGVIVGDYTVDLLVENTVLVEMKAIKIGNAAHIAQCRRYLKATGLGLCLLINFDKPRLKIKHVAGGP
jgi:GxxExxY protein